MLPLPNADSSETMTCHGNGAELYLAYAGATIRVLLLEADLCQIEMAIVCSGFLQG